MELRIARIYLMFLQCKNIKTLCLSGFVAKKMNHKFFINSEFENKTFTFDKTDAHHIKNVLRLKKNNLIEIAFSDVVYECKIVGIKSKKIEIQPTKFLRKIKPSIPEIVLFQSIPKLNKFDLILEKCTELGINKIIPVITERTNAKQVSSKYILRWNKILISASKQSRRDTIPELIEPIKFEEIKTHLKNKSLKILFYEVGTHNHDSINYSNEKIIYYFIGPEGSLTDCELNYLKNKKFIDIKLKLPVLRVETAAIVGLTTLLYKINKL